VDLPTIKRVIRRAERLVVLQTADRHASYRDDPHAYAREILRVNLTPDQSDILVGLLQPPYRVKARAGHGVGKTHAAAVAVNWWFDTRDPGVCITTAPTERDVIDLLWTEVRLQRQRANLSQPFVGPSAPEMRTGEEHYAKGYTARKGESFQGRHRPAMLFVFDEDEGIEPAYWRTLNTMFQPGGGHACLSIGNPTTTTSQSYAEEQLVDLDGDPKWTLFTLSCLNHPNVLAELDGKPRPIPDAVSLHQVDGYFSEWCSPVEAGDQRAGDLEWRPGSGNWFRPGPIFESRVLGQRPTQGVDSVWSEAAFATAGSIQLEWDLVNQVPEIGCDVARFGDDWTSIHTRVGPVSLEHQTGNGWSVPESAGRCVREAKRAAAWWNELTQAHKTVKIPTIDAKRIPIKVDDDGVGGGVVDLLREGKYNAVPVNAASAPRRPSDYPLRRDELWFDVARRGALGLVSFKRLLKQTLAKLKQQALAPLYTLDPFGRRRVERKADTKKRTGGRSPDDMDAVNLAYCEQGQSFARAVIRPKEPDRDRW
jgi:hypothetical protein